MKTLTALVGLAAGCVFCFHSQSRRARNEAMRGIPKAIDDALVTGNTIPTYVALVEATRPYRFFCQWNIHYEPHQKQFNEELEKQILATINK